MMILFLLLFLAIDIGSKLLVSRLMAVGDSIMVIKNFFYLTYVRNTGAAWSIFAGKTWLLILVSLVIISLIILYVLKNKTKSKLETIGYSLILGGAIGNLIDRIVYGYVIDFFDFLIFGYNYPIFNVADSFIFLGVVILIICAWGCKDGNKGSRQ